jgi:hypothetical protein
MTATLTARRQAYRFRLAHLVMTWAINDRVAMSEPFARGIVDALRRHLRGDWGEVCREDARLNDLALRDGDRLLSAYTIDGERVWIITDADRSATTVLYPHEY